MERAGKLLARMKLAQKVCSEEELARAAWPAAVGKRIHAVSRVLGLHQGKLIVEVEDAVWKSHLEALQPFILRNFESIIGKAIVTGLEFRVALPRRMPRREAIPARAGDGFLAFAPAAPSQGRITDEADGIRDPVLRRIYRNSRKRAGA